MTSARKLFPVETEELALEEVLNQHEIRHYKLVELARITARRIAELRGTVTGPQVLKMLKNSKAEGIDDVDPRFLGAVFRNGWIRVGFSPEGSHRRPVSVWRLK